jgi:hypothetical protein
MSLDNETTFENIMKGQIPSMEAADSPEVIRRVQAILENPGDDGYPERIEFLNFMKDAYGFTPTESGAVFHDVYMKVRQDGEA